MNENKSYDIADLSLAPEGKKKIEWSGREMPVLKLIRSKFAKTKPLAGITVACCLHVTAETANLMLTLQAGGARVILYNTNPLSTQDDVAACLVKNYGISCYAIKNMPREKYEKYINSVLNFRPNITLDDGADLIATIHKKRKDLLNNIIGGTEETTTGVIRIRSLEKRGLLKYPLIAVNDSETKYLFDNRYGTGQSTIDGILRATNILLAGKKFVIFGYGWCGKGIAKRASGMGAQVIICEVDPVKALEAVMDGFSMMPSTEAVKTGDIFVTVTGDKSVLDKKHFSFLKDGAILANSGHFNVEINLGALEKITGKKTRVRPMLDEYLLNDGRKIYLVGEGRLANLAAAEGHPAAVMDLSFADQALCVEYLVRNKGKLASKVFKVPDAITDKVARLKLNSLNIKIDNLTPEQKDYLSGWEEGAFG